MYISSDKGSVTKRFAQVVQVPENEAAFYLECCQGNIELALNMYLNQAQSRGVSTSHPQASLQHIMRSSDGCIAFLFPSAGILHGFTPCHLQGIVGSEVLSSSPQPIASFDGEVTGFGETLQQHWQIMEDRLSRRRILKGALGPGPVG